jgi:hypothetical protein
MLENLLGGWTQNSGKWRTDHMRKMWERNICEENTMNVYNGDDREKQRRHAHKPLWEQNVQERKSMEPLARLGKWGATVGGAMLVLSLILMLAGISSRILHNILQFGGVGLLVVGFLFWRDNI